MVSEAPPFPFEGGPGGLRTELAEESQHDGKPKEPEQHVLVPVKAKAPVPKTAQLCSTLGGAAANSHYIVQHYGSLPQNAQAKTCSASCCTKCSDFLCPHGFVNIDQVDQKIGSLKESCCVEGSLFPNSVLVNQKHQTLPLGL